MTNNRPLRVAIVSNIYPPLIGGPASQAALFAEGFAEAGATPLVLTYGSDGRRNGAVQYIRKDADRSLAGRVRRYFETLRRVSDHLTEFEPDLVLVQTSAGPLQTAAALVARRLGVPSVLKIANDPLLDYEDARSRTQRTALGRIRYQMGRAVKFATTAITLRLHRQVWATTDAFAHRMARRYGIRQRRILVAPNLFRLPETALSQPERSRAEVELLFVGRLKPIKGVDILIDALGGLRDLPWTLRIAGEGDAEYEGWLRRRAEAAGISDRLQWMGTLDGENLDQAYRGADLLVVPSRSEAFGNVIVEAMAHGVPVVATAVGGTPFLLEEGKAGCLVREVTPEGLGREIAGLIREPERRLQLAETGPRRVREFALQPGIERWLSYARAARSRAKTGL